MTQLLLLLLFVVPGFVYQSVRISVRGRLPADIELSTRIVRAIASSGIFALVYTVILGDLLVEAAHGEGPGFEHPRVGAALALLGGIVVPAALALAKFPNWRWLEKPRSKLPQFTFYDPTPTAWDRAFQNLEQCFIRILNDQGHWMAGFYGPSSYATSYPEPNQLFLEQAFGINEDGTILEPIEGVRGLLIDCSEIQLLQIVTAIGEEDR